MSLQRVGQRQLAGASGVALFVPATMLPVSRPGGRPPVPGASAGTPGAGSPPTPVDALVAAGSGVASQIPGPAGTAAAQVLRSVGSTADNLFRLGR